MTPLLDVHCHVDLFPDYEAVIRETEASRVFTLAVTNAPSVFQRCKELLEGTHFLHAAVGLHPQLVTEREHETDLLLRLIREVTYVGEVGLDFTQAAPAVRRLQQDIFSGVLQRCAQVGHRVLSIHSRRAPDETIELVEAYQSGTPILHWYSGPRRLVKRALEAGCYFSINSAMLRSESGRRIIETLPRDRVLTETDGPFVDAFGRAARPVDVVSTTNRLARVWGLVPAVAATMLARNLVRALRLTIDPWSAHPVSDGGERQRG